MLVLLNVDICCTSKYAEVPNIWLLVVECRVWSAKRKGRCGRAIMGMDKTSDSIAPEGLRELCFSKHGSSTFSQSAICTFGYAILMRLIAYCMLALNTALGKMQGELI